MLPRHRHVRRLLFLLPKPLPLSTSATTASSPPEPAPTSTSAAVPTARALTPTRHCSPPDDAIALLQSVADSEGSAAALALFRCLSARPDVRHLMRLYATAATFFVARGNQPMAHECARAMVAAFGERGRLREAADMLLGLRSHGLPLAVETANWVLRVGLRHHHHPGGGCFAHARQAFDRMTRARWRRRATRRTQLPGSRARVLPGRMVEEADALLAAMWR